MLVGLLGKNAVLIVEFAVQKHRKGATVLEAAIEGAKVRFRPILMTSIAFIAGVSPLAFSVGAGAQSRHAIGTGVMGGMFAVTVLAIFLVPVFFVVVRRFFPGHARQATEHEGSQHA